MDSNKASTLAHQAILSHRLFAGIDMSQLSSFLDRLKEERFSAGATILQEGQSGDRMYLIMDGCVEVVKRVLGKETVDHEVIAALNAGETFGEMELVDMQPRSATIRAKSDVIALSLSGLDLHAISGTDAKTFSLILMNLAREMSLRLRTTDAWLAGSLFSIRRQETDTKNA